MANWDEKYFVTELQGEVGGGSWSPTFSDEEAMRLIELDSDVRKGAFYMASAWFWPGSWPATKDETGTIKEHSHEFDEAIAYIGTNPDDPYDLGGEMDFWIDGKQNIIDRSFIAFIPAGTKHGPITINRIDRPIFHFTSGMGEHYR